MVPPLPYPPPASTMAYLPHGPLAHHPAWPPANQAYYAFHGIPGAYEARAAHDLHQFAHRPRRPANPLGPTPPPPPASFLQPPARPPPTAYLQLPARQATPPRRSHPTTPTMAPPSKRKVAAAEPSTDLPTKRRKLLARPATRTTPDAAAVPTAPAAPCRNGRCHFHRLRCGHVIKTPLNEPPSPCATNCATAPPTTASSSISTSSSNDKKKPTAAALTSFGPAPFECPICVARTLSLVWKMDVVNLKRQLPTLSLEAFAAWVRANYSRAWEQRRAVRLEAWMGRADARRECWQLTMRERGLVAWNAGEAKAPYPIEEFRRVYERREVRVEFWNQTYRDNTIESAEDEAEPGVVCQSVEKPGVHYPAEWALIR